MIKTIARRIIRVGLKDLNNPLEYRRVLLINSLSFFSILICWLTTFLLLLQDRYPTYAITFIGGALFASILALNHYGYYRPARNIYLALSLSIVYSTTLIAFFQGRDNEVENILIGFMASSFFFYDGKKRGVIYILFLAALISLKFLRNKIIGIPYDFNFILNIQITLTLSLIIYLFSSAIRGSLMMAFEKMRKQDEVLYAMIDNVPIFIGFLDSEGRYRMMNKEYERYFGISRDKFIGLKAIDVLPEKVYEKQRPYLEKALRGESQEFLHDLEMPNGEKVTATGKYVPLKNKNGEVTAVSVYLNDVTKLEKAKEELRRANKTKDQLFSIIAHDIRSPLNLFESVLAFAKDKTLTHEQFLDYQEVVKEKLDALRKTLDTLLDWAKSQLEGIHAAPTLVPLRRILDEDLKLFEPLVQQKSIDFSINIPENEKVWIDENHLKVIIRNLVHNALKFTPQGGSIALESKAYEQYVALSIRDSGRGMSRERISSILNKELQKSETGTLGEGGNGLGLSLSLTLLEKNDCEVNIHSELEKGTRFEIRIPKKIEPLVPKDPILKKGF